MPDSDQVVTCRNCGEEMPATASRCPHCDMRVTTLPWAIGLACFGLLVSVGFVVAHFQGFIPNNWQAGVGAGIFIIVMGARLYWIRKQTLENAHLPDT